MPEAGFAALADRVTINFVFGSSSSFLSMSREVARCGKVVQHQCEAVSAPELTELLKTKLKLASLL